MKKLLSLPPNLVGCFHEITGFDRDEWFCTNDPVDKKLGSGGGTTWLLQRAFQSSLDDNEGLSFDGWLCQGKRLLLHAGGQGRRLPAYSPSGKVLMPIPVFRWERGQRLSQDLLSLQVPLYERIMDAAPEGLHTMVVSGDVYIRATEALQPIPDVDVVCYGLWLGAEIAKDHGVFVMSRHKPAELKCMLQKPSVETLNHLLKDHLYLTDIGIWLLSDRAVKMLMKRSITQGVQGVRESGSNGNCPCIYKESGENRHEGATSLATLSPEYMRFYDLYSDFGCCLGTDPTILDDEIKDLKVAILPLPGGEFYHYGTSPEIISSTLAVQNLVNDQREIMHHSRKPHPSMFIQNAETWIKITSDNHHLWIENSCVSERWTLAHHHIITGVPENQWEITLRAGQCVDIVPIGEDGYAVRPYGFEDKFKGMTDHDDTLFIGQPFMEWFRERQIPFAETCDIQSAKLFPVVHDIGDVGLVLRWMLNEPYQQGGRMLWERAVKLSADDISNQANLVRLFCQRKENRMKNWPFLANNHAHSVFYQVDLEDAAKDFAQGNIAMPHPLSDEEEPLLTRIHDAMFRSELERRKGLPCQANEEKAFGLLRQGLTSQALAKKQSPKMSVYGDQIVWGRSPVRIDIAGGWTDTPPYCLMEGGCVVNFAIELNGQPPLQAFVKPCKIPHIVLRSIDLGASETVTSYDEIADIRKVGNPFSIPKAALVLSGFHPRFSSETFVSLEEQLRVFGCGIELTLLSAIPAGSGLGTSSLLASTVLGALNDFCGLSWDKNEIGHRTLVLEQLLTTGGGWQDQFGGLLPGVKLLQTEREFNQDPVVRWLPSRLYTEPEYRACHLLYYTGITRTAKKILAEIVRKMFLNQHEEIAMLREMKAHAMDMFEAIQRENFTEMGRLVGKTWIQNQTIDTGTNPPEVRRLTDLIDDLCLGYKLPGAGGGGYLYMIAKDPEAAVRIKQILQANRQNANARFVDMSLSEKGLQVSRS